MQRRAVLKSAAAVALTTAIRPIFGAVRADVPVIDSHVHLFDPTRPGGVPWPESSDSVLYHPALPGRYAQLAEPHGVVGAIAVECSPWLVDNFWLEDVVEQNPIMLGYIGDLSPDAPDFGAALDRLHRSPRFLGIRYGNLWNRDLGAAAQNAGFVAGLKLLAQAGLVLETANPDAALIAAVLQVSDRVPDLRIVLDHLPHAQIPPDAAMRATYETNLRELANRPKIYVKGSEIVKSIDGRVSLDPASYKAGLDQLWDLFGEGRIFFGSDWPNSDSMANYDDTFAVAQRYISTRSVEARQKYFFKNSISVYKWRPRTAAQQQLQNS
jgi:predicted TIM-barrel fold metal-dependent hydrolase